ncbi:UNVERIFIED_CONTAM: Cytosolic endo-beta-N-acetylglucosaminidase 1 [Sesamum angustifolium]|uniref:mannosyl-glycoprotein endo-beta-N-acetylglucosaminidase n=1 Tax=Sesamum angustifolium TaxID=2727405 RepID=A0AAW2PUQ7_9LAMI
MSPVVLLAGIKAHHHGSFSALEDIRDSAMAQTNGTDSAADPPPPFDPLAPAVPISYPLKTLEELETRAYFKSFHFPFNQAGVKLPAGGGGAEAMPQRPRVLVCHDMAGGYTDDGFVQGGTNADAYAIWHWYLIDVFVYFSHNLVTLPPPCWTNTAHTHGVKVLGTLIMEWDGGRKEADKLLSTKTSAQMYAELLAELAVALGFDGWLNQLNDLNKPFFDRCDGILVNYSWEENFPKLSAEVAGDRKLDVYMGIDVFGRGTYGGGQWTTNVALDVIKKDGVSAGIFAPGWVYETNQPPDFQTAQNRWWGLVEKSWGTVQSYPKVLPFYSNFDQPFLEYPGDSTAQPIQVSVGFKEASYSGGGNVTFRGTLGDNAEFTARLFLGELLLGNSPLHITYSVKSSGNSLLGLALATSTTTNDKKTVFLAASGNALLTMNQFSSHFTQVIMPCRVTMLEAQPGWIMQETSIEMHGHILKEIRAVCYRSKPKNSHAVTDDKPDSSAPSEYYAVLGDIKITTSGENTNFPPSTAWTVDGQFVSWTSGPKGSKNLSVKIAWHLKDGNVDLFSKYNIYVNKLTSVSSVYQSEMLDGSQEYIGVAAVKSFYISDLEVASGISSLKFIIQVCSPDGACQKLEESPFFLLPVQGA